MKKRIQWEEPPSEPTTPMKRVRSMRYVIAAAFILAMVYLAAFVLGFDWAGGEPVQTSTWLFV